MQLCGQKLEEVRSLLMARRQRHRRASVALTVVGRKAQGQGISIRRRGPQTPAVWRAWQALSQDLPQSQQAKDWKR